MDASEKIARNRLSMLKLAEKLGYISEAAGGAAWIASDSIVKAV